LFGYQCVSAKNKEVQYFLLKLRQLFIKKNVYFVNDLNLPMRKITTTIVLVLLMFSTNTFSQVCSFQFEGAKNYDNGTIIAYFFVNGIADNHQAYFVQSELRKETSINRFFVYPYKNGSNRCMIECSQQINESDIQTLINNSIVKYNKLFSESENLREFYLDLYSISNMPKYIDTGDRRNDVLSFKEKFAIWKEQNPDKYQLIRTIPIDTFIQK
jgi:hypothetical protein